MCSNHLTSVLLMLMLFSLLIPLGDMMYYVCYFMKNTYYSCFSQNLPRGEIVVPFGLTVLGKITYDQDVF